jgi:hypothetical protein
MFNFEDSNYIEMWIEQKAWDWTAECNVTIFYMFPDAMPLPF